MVLHAPPKKQVFHRISQQLVHCISAARVKSGPLVVTGIHLKFEG